jgi:hypothetical protein
MKTKNAKPFKLFEVEGIQILYERGFDSERETEHVKTTAYIDGLRVETTGTFKEGKGSEAAADKSFAKTDQVSADKWLANVKEMLSAKS